MSSTLSPALIRAARGLVGWSQDKLALEAGLARATVAAYEQGREYTSSASLRRMQRALEAAGVRFVQEQAWEGVVHARPTAPPLAKTTK
jgi:transcriptional regulator with XRE-family HTH domain